MAVLSCCLDHRVTMGLASCGAQKLVPNLNATIFWFRLPLEFAVPASVRRSDMVWTLLKLLLVALRLRLAEPPFVDEREPHLLRVSGPYRALGATHPSFNVD